MPCSDEQVCNATRNVAVQCACENPGSMLIDDDAIGLKNGIGAGS